MANTPNILDHNEVPDLSDGESMVCIWGQRSSDDDGPVEVVVKFNWAKGETAAIPCDNEEDAQALIDAIARYADPIAVHIVSSSLPSA